MTTKTAAHLQAAPVATTLSAELPQPFLTDVELAERWRMSPKTLRNLRVRGDHVPFVRIGRLVRYQREAILAFEEQHKMASTSTHLTVDAGTRRSG